MHHRMRVCITIYEAERDWHLIYRHFSDFPTSGEVLKG